MTQAGYLFPRINEMALHVSDPYNRSVYIHGGIPWSKNPIGTSPTRLPADEFFRFDVDRCKELTGEWSELNVIADPVDRFQFANDCLDSGIEDQLLEQPDFRQLPGLAGHMGSIYLDPSTRSPYLIIFGGLGVEEPEDCDENYSVDEQILTEISLGGDVIYAGPQNVVPSNSVISVDLSTYEWRNITLDSNGNVEKRFQGVTVVSGSKMFVFGGLVQQRNDPRTVDYAETYSVLDLEEHKWIVAKKKLPSFVKVLGSYPAASTYVDKDGNELIIILRGEHRTLETSFSNVHIFNPITSLFSKIITLGEHIPPALDYFVLQIIPSGNNSRSAKEATHSSCDTCLMLFGWVEYLQKTYDTDSASDTDVETDDEKKYDDGTQNTRELCIWKLDVEGKKWSRMRASTEQTQRIESKMSIEVGAVFPRKSTTEEVALHLLGFDIGASRTPAGRRLNCHEVLLIRDGGRSHETAIDDEEIFDEVTVVGSDIDMEYTLDLFM